MACYVEFERGPVLLAVRVTDSQLSIRSASRRDVEDLPHLAEVMYGILGAESQAAERDPLDGGT